MGTLIDSRQVDFHETFLFFSPPSLCRAVSKEQDGFK